MNWDEFKKEVLKLHPNLELENMGVSGVYLVINKFAVKTTIDKYSLAYTKKCKDWTYCYDLAKIQVERYGKK